MEKTMRLPTCEEWDRLVEITGGDDAVMHWDEMFSWCDDVALKDPAYRASRGYHSVRCQFDFFASYRNGPIGFRPVLDLPDDLWLNGSQAIMGTLYMDGQPIKIPQRPSRDGDIMDYIPGAKLELREALPDPAYQMVGIKVGSVVIADRVMLRKISWNDIQNATGKKETPLQIDPEEKALRLPTCEEWDRLVGIADGNDAIMHWDWMYSWCADADPGHPEYRACRGYFSARYWDYYSASRRYVILGFRPALDLLGPGAPDPDGSKIVMGTLYMGGQPVKIPQDPAWDGDITDYIPGAKLELREALPDPAYQMMGIKVGSVLIADRAMLKKISWEDIQNAAKGPAPAGSSLTTWEIQILCPISVKIHASDPAEALEKAQELARRVGGQVGPTTAEELIELQERKKPE